MRAQLLPLDGSSAIEIAKDLLVVGRREDCDLRLEHKSVSKIHCVIIKTDGLLMLRDLGSTNGTRVNGTRVRRAALLPNDQLNIAGYKFRIYLGPDGPAPKCSRCTSRTTRSTSTPRKWPSCCAKPTAAAEEKTRKTIPRKVPSSNRFTAISCRMCIQRIGRRGYRNSHR